MGRARRRRLRGDDEPAARAPRASSPTRCRSRRSRVEDEAQSARRHGQGALPHRRRASGRGGADALPRRPPLDLRLLAVGLPAHVHVLRHRRDEVRPQPARVRDPRPGAALPPARAGRTTSSSWGWASRCSTSTRCSRRRCGCRTSGSRTGARRSRPSAGCPACGASSTRSSSRSGSRSRSTPPTRGCARELMPVNDRFPLPEVLAECRRYFALRRRKVFVEYVMLAGVNDSPERARELADAARPEGLQGEPDPVQPDRDLRRLVARGDRRLQERARPRPPPVDGAAHPRPRHRRACGQLAATR